MRFGLLTCLLVATACGDRGLTVTFNNQDPEVSIQWPTPDSELPANTQLTLVAIAADPETAPEDLSITWTSTLDGPLAGGGEWTRVGEEVSLSLPNGLSEGEHSLTIAVADEDGATASASVDMTAVPNQPPLVNIVAPAVEDNVVIRTDEQYRMELTVSDDSDSPGDLTVEWSGSLSEAADLPTTFNADGTMGVILPELQAGSYVASISVRDRYGAEGFEQTTLTVIVDQDQDGVAAEDDCDDDDPDSFPGAVDICDGIDNDCDGTPDNNPPIWYPDTDGDLFGAGTGVQACDAPDGHVADNTDCDDTDIAQFPGADEVCNGEDDDCNDLIDDNPVDAIAYYPDADNDGQGDDDAVVLACEAPSGIYVETPGDCDDGNGTIFTGADEVCDGADNDCDDRIDEEPPTWYADGDDDGFGLESTATVQCDPPTASSVQQGGDCDDTNLNVNPDATEICNEIDDDCNNIVDDSTTEGTEWYADLDGDGFGDDLSVQLACVQPEGTVERPFDCDDSDPHKNPTAEELCNNEDDDCDGNLEDALWVGEGHPYAMPSAAISAAATGDMVCIDSGAYNETMNFGGKNLRVLGVDRDSVIITSTAALRFTNSENADSLLAHMTFDPRPVDGSDPSLISCGGFGCMLSITNASPVLRDLRFSGFISSARGTAAPGSISGGSARFEDVEFVDLFVDANDINARHVTGALYTRNWTGSADGLVFSGIRTGTGRSFSRGTALYLLDGDTVLRDVSVTDTQATSIGGNQGVINISGGTHVFENLDIRDNSHTLALGGALYMINADVTVRGGRLLDNHVAGSSPYGGAIYLDGSDLTLENVDLVGNSVSGSNATCGGGAIGHGGTAPASVTLVNSILMNNESTCAGNQVGGAIASTFTSDTDHPLSVFATYTNVFGNDEPEYATDFNRDFGDGMLSVDAGYRNIFVQDSLQWDTGLLNSSPMRNAGDPTIDNTDGTRSHIGSTGGPEGI